MTILILIRKKGFDNNRNYNPDYEEILKTFVDTPEKTAYARVQEYLKSLPLEHFYMGYDYNVYPKYVIKREEQF